MSDPKKEIYKGYPVVKLQAVTKWMTAKDRLTEAEQAEQAARVELAGYYPSHTTCGALTHKLPDSWTLSIQKGRPLFIELDSVLAWAEKHKIDRGILGCLKMEVEQERNRLAGQGDGEVTEGSLVLHPETIKVKLIGPKK